MQEIKKNYQQVKNNTEEPRGCLNTFLTFLSGALGICLVLLLLFIGCYITFWAAGGILIIADPLEKADAVAALSGGNIDRVEYAAELMHEKYASLLILTETGENVPELGRSYTTLLRTEAIRLGVPNTAILFTKEPASSTYEEAIAIEQLMHENNIKSIIVVTDAYHSFRTKLIFREVFKGSDKHAIVRPVSGQWYQSKTWWLNPRGWQATINEYTKLFAYMLGVKSD